MNWPFQKVAKPFVPSQPFTPTVPEVPPAPKKQRKKPVRIVHGRVRVNLDGRDWWFEQRKDGIHFKPLHGRHWKVIGFQEMYDKCVEQFRLPI